MKKIILFITFICVTTIVNAQQFAQSTKTKSSQSFSILPRYFNDNIILTNIATQEKSCELYIFSTKNGKTVISQFLTIQDYNYKISTNKLRKGEYVYFIVENNVPIFRGTFIKS